MRCKKPNGTISVVTWRLFKVNCRKNNSSCSAASNAYVAAVTVCAQRLF